MPAMSAQTLAVSLVRARWALVTAVRNSDKSDLETIIERLRKRGVRVAGFVQRAVRGEDHELRRMGSGDRAWLGRRGTVPRSATEEVFCSFSFDRVAFERAREWLTADAADADVLIVDEVSKLEVAGGGHAPLLSWALALPPEKIVLVIARAHQLAGIVERFGLGDAVATLDLPGDEPAREQFCSAIASAVVANVHL